MNSEVSAADADVGRGIVEQDVGDKRFHDGVYRVVEIKHSVPEGLVQAAPGYIGGIEPGGIDAERPEGLASGSVAVAIGHFLAAHIPPDSVSGAGGVSGLHEGQLDLPGGIEVDCPVVDILFEAGIFGDRYCHE